MAAKLWPIERERCDTGRGFQLTDRHGARALIRQFERLVARRVAVGERCGQRDRAALRDHVAKHVPAAQAAGRDLRLRAVAGEGQQAQRGGCKKLSSVCFHGASSG